DLRTAREDAAKHESEGRTAREDACGDLADRNVGSTRWGRDRKPGGGLTRADIRGPFVVEYVPLNAQLASCRARCLYEAHLQHDLLRLAHLDRIDDFGRELFCDRHGFVERYGVGRRAREHDA